MPDMYFDVDASLTEVPVNLMPLIDDTDFKTIEAAVAYDAAGMDLRWNFCTSAGAYTSTPVAPTTAGVHDWAHQGDGMYTLEIPDTGGTINNDTEGYGWFSGVVTGVLPFRGPVIGFRSAALNNALCDGGAVLSVNLDTIKTQTVTCAAGVTIAAYVGTAAASTAQTGDCYARLGAPAGASVSADVASIKVDTGTTILARLPAALVSGRIDASVGAMAANVITATAINADAITAAKIADGAIDNATFAADVSTGTRISGAVTTSLVAHNLDHLCLTATAAADMTTEVADNTIISRILANGDTSAFDPSTDGLQPIKDASVTAAALVDLFCDEPLSGHTTAGTVGKGIADASSAGDPWATAIPGAYGAGTAGKILGDNIDAAISSRLAPTTAARTLTVDAEGFVVLSDAVEHGGTTATLVLQSVAVANSTNGAPAVSITATGTGNAHGLYVNAANGHGFALGSTNSYGMSISSGAVTALTVAGGGTGHAISTTPGTGGFGLNATLSTTTLTAIADALLNRDMATGTDSGSPTVRTVRQALRILRNKVTKSGGTLTVYKEDDTTATWSGAYTTANAYPVDMVDPA